MTSFFLKLHVFNFRKTNTSQPTTKGRQSLTFSYNKCPLFTLPKIELTKNGERDGQIPSVNNGNNSSSVNGDLLPRRLRHVKMLKRRIAPTSVIVGQSKIWRTEICCRNGNRFSRQTPLIISTSVTLYLKTFPARSPVIKQSCAQRRRIRPISRTIQVPISASPSCIKSPKSPLNNDFQAKSLKLSL